MTTEQWLAAGCLGLFMFCILCAVVFGVLALIDRHQHHRRTK